MKKIRFVLLSVFLFLSEGLCFCDSELEILWQKCEVNDEGIFSARQNLNYYQVARKTSRVLYPLSLELSAGPDFYRNYEQYSDEIELGNASATLTQTLPGGAKLSAGAAYAVYSGYRNWNVADGYTDKGYKDSFSAHVQYTQSLNPYWAHGVLRNPAKNKLFLSTEGGELNLMQARKNSYSKVLSLYLKFRRNARNLLLSEKEVAMLKINLDSVREMSVSNTAFLSDVWQAEKLLGEAESSLNSYLLEKEEVIKSLSELCGHGFEISEEADLSDEPKRAFDTDPFLNNLQIQLKILDSQLLLDNQNSAALISFSGRFKETSKLKDEIGLDFKDETNYFSWSTSVSCRINNLYGGEGKLHRKKYETERAKYEKQISEYKKKIAAEKAYFDNLILSYEEDIRNAALNEANEKEKFEGIKYLYENGQKRQIDVLSAEINYLRQKIALKNLCDALWQNKWLRLQFAD